MLTDGHDQVVMGAADGSSPAAIMWWTQGQWVIQRLGPHGERDGDPIALEGATIIGSTTTLTMASSGPAALICYDSCRFYQLDSRSVPIRNFAFDGGLGYGLRPAAGGYQWLEAYAQPTTATYLRRLLSFGMTPERVRIESGVSSGVGGLVPLADGTSLVTWAPRVDGGAPLVALRYDTSGTVLSTNTAPDARLWWLQSCGTPSGALAVSWDLAWPNWNLLALAVDSSGVPAAPTSSIVLTRRAASVSPGSPAMTFVGESVLAVWSERNDVGYQVILEPLNPQTGAPPAPATVLATTGGNNGVAILPTTDGGAVVIYAGPLHPGDTSQGIASIYLSCVP